MDKQQVDIIDLNIGENYLNDWEVYYAIRGGANISDKTHANT